MKKEDLKRIKDKVEILMGMRMVEMIRWDDYVEFGFVPGNKDEAVLQAELKKIERIDFDYVIAAFGCFRWLFKDRVILAERDMYQPSLPILEANNLTIGEGYKVENYNYNERGNNRLDEINDTIFRPIYQQTRSFIVKKVTVSKYGDLTLDFENGYRLEIFIDVSDALLCWDFYQPTVINNIRVGANEIIEEDVDVTQT